MDFLAKDYNTRAELEKAIASSVGLTADFKPDHEIKGTRAELKKLFLSHGKFLWGIIANASDYERPVKPAQINRGKIFKSKIV